MKRDDRTEDYPSENEAEESEKGGEDEETPSENDLVLIDSQGKDTTLWTVKGDKDREPGIPFGNWIPHKVS